MVKNSKKGPPPNLDAEKDIAQLDALGGAPSNVIRLSGIPHGFYEQEIAGFFSQFGTLKKVRVARNPISGRSKGFGFVEFKHANVARIAAEAMNNYMLMENKLQCVNCSEEWLQARPHLFRGWDRMIDPDEQRKRITERSNLAPTEEAYCERIHKLAEEDRETRAEILEKGMNYEYPPFEELIPQDSLYHNWLKLKLAKDKATEENPLSGDRSTSRSKRKLGLKEHSETELINGEELFEEDVQEDGEEEIGQDLDGDKSLSSETENEEVPYVPQLQPSKDQSVSFGEWIDVDDDVSGSGKVMNAEEEYEILSAPQVDLSPPKSKSQSKGSHPTPKKSKKSKKRKMK